MVIMDSAKIPSMVMMDLRTVTVRALYSPSGSSACGEIEQGGPVAACGVH